MYQQTFSLLATQARTFIQRLLHSSYCTVVREAESNTSNVSAISTTHQSTDKRRFTLAIATEELTTQFT